MKRGRGDGWCGLVVAGILVLSTPARAVDYWVGPGGSDAASGLDAGNAWASLQRAAD